MLYYYFVMKGMDLKKKLIIFAAAAAVLFVAVTTVVAITTFKSLKKTENFSEIDYYSVQKFSDKNVQAVMDALKSGKAEALAAKMKAAESKEGVEKVMEYADWTNADFENAVGMGAGSLSPSPDSNGYIDISERFFVNVGDTKYVLFVETVASRWGRNNEGVSAVAVTGFKHFDELGYAWNGKPDDESATAGTLFWTGNQADGEDSDY